jgi:hypothetical protein
VLLSMQSTTRAVCVKRATLGQQDTHGQLQIEEPEGSDSRTNVEQPQAFATQATDSQSQGHRFDPRTEGKGLSKVKINAIAALLEYDSPQADWRTICLTQS